VVKTGLFASLGGVLFLVGLLSPFDLACLQAFCTNPCLLNMSIDLDREFLDVRTINSIGHSM